MDKKLLCIETYEEDSEEIWTKGQTYDAKLVNNNGKQVWEIETNFDRTGCIGEDFLVSDINKLFDDITSVAE